MHAAFRLISALFPALVLSLAALPAAAQIFGADNLDDLVESGVLNQCYTGLGDHNAPVGKVTLMRDGKRMFSASAQVVFDPSIVVTTGHMFATDPQRLAEGAEPDVLPGDTFVFRVYEGDRSNCHEVEYDVVSYVLGSDDSYEDAENDFAVLRLDHPVRAYPPLLLPDEEQIRAAIDGRRRITIMGFPATAKTEYGKHLSSQTCFAQFPPERNALAGEDMLIWNCDSAVGLSGAALMFYDPEYGAEAEADRYIVGIVRGSMAQPWRGGFNRINNFNMGPMVHERFANMVRCVAAGWESCDDEAVLHSYVEGTRTVPLPRPRPAAAGEAR